MFGLGFSEILILVLIAFLVFGPKQFPFIVKECVKLLNELKHSFSNIKSDISKIETEVHKQLSPFIEEAHKDLDFEKAPKKELLSVKKEKEETVPTAKKDLENSLSNTKPEKR